MLSGDSEENSGRHIRSSRLSVDDKLIQKNSAKGPSTIQLKKPIRKSLPKLPSQKTNMASEKNAAASQKNILVEETNKLASQETSESNTSNASSVQNNVEPHVDPSLIQSDISYAPEVKDGILMQETITSEY